MKIKLGNLEFELVGKTIEVNNDAPDARLINTKLQEIHLHDYFNKLTVISTFPSIDTPVCDNQTRTLLKKYEKNDKLHLISISEDLPFAQAKWCAAEGVKDPIILSDYQKHDFGEKYGLLIGGINLLARAAIIVKNRKVVYAEIVKDEMQSINFEKLYEEIEKNLK